VAAGGAFGTIGSVLAMKRHLIAALVHPPVSLFQLSCLFEAFQEAPRDCGWYKLAVGGMNPGYVGTTTGIDIHIAHGLELFSLADTIIIPSWDIDLHPPCEIATALKSAAASGARLIGLESGAFLLGALGLLDGKRAATHWTLADSFARRFPKVITDRDTLYVDDGRILTGAGGTATLDLLIHVIRKDHGVKEGRLVADQMLLQGHRAGNQPQRVRRSVARKEDNRIGAVLEHLRSNVAGPHRKEELAAIAAMSVRTFYRRFTAEIGITPNDWLIQERVTIAKELLEESNLSIDQIGAEAGFGSTQSFRIHFAKIVGVTPAVYRRQRLYPAAGDEAAAGNRRTHTSINGVGSQFGGRRTARPLHG
jgi:AraC family transcriptional regulator, transcriptional activator FtrA